MNIRQAIAASGLAALAITPVATYADGADRAIDACVKSFVDNYLPKGQIVRVRKVEPPTSPVTELLAIRAATFTIDLTARGARSGVELARARCVASRRGDVIVLDAPDDAISPDYVAVVTR